MLQSFHVKQYGERRRDDFCPLKLRRWPLTVEAVWKCFWKRGYGGTSAADDGGEAVHVHPGIPEARGADGLKNSNSQERQEPRVKPTVIRE